LANEKLFNQIADLRVLLSEIKMGKASTDLLNDIKVQLNIIFGEDKCKQVYYTNNTDKLFFGVCVMPVLPSNDVINIFLNDDRYIINNYYLELDSKLFEPYLDLSIDEITAIIMHEIGTMVTDSTPIEIIKKEIDKYLVAEAETIKLSDSINYVELLSYGIRDAIRKTISIFEVEEDNIITQLDKDLGIEVDVATGMKKIINMGDNPNSDINNKLIFLSWILRLYKNIKKYRIQAIHSLKRGIELSSSKLEQKEMENIIYRLQRIDDESLIKEGSYLLREGVLDDVYNNLKKGTKKMKSEGISRYDDEYYEFEFRLNNIETSDDALLMIHQINSRMAVIRDLLDTEEIDKSTRARWEELYQRYDKLRGKISQSKIYANKTRLYVNYGVDD
jgi:hypothetical protein